MSKIIKSILAIAILSFCVTAMATDEKKLDTSVSIDYMHQHNDGEDNKNEAIVGSVTGDATVTDVETDVTIGDLHQHNYGDDNENRAVIGSSTEE